MKLGSPARRAVSLAIVGGVAVTAACSEHGEALREDVSPRAAEPVARQGSALTGEVNVWKNACTGVCGTRPPASEAPAAFDPRLGKSVVLSGATYGWDGKAWSTLAPAAGGLASRGGAAMTFHGALNALILFGGTGPVGGPGHYDDTWAWNYTASAWGTLSVTKPVELTGRNNAMMAYDAARSAAVLFGGESGTPQDGGGYQNSNLNDTWTLVANGSGGWKWELRSPANRPPPRNNGRMVYDTARSRVLLFGGWGEDPINYVDGGAAKSGPLDDLWAWDGTNWTQLSPATRPPRRTTFGMAYDKARDRVVVFGGWGVVQGNLTYCDDTANNCNRLGDTWEFDGVDWVKVTTTPSPSPRVGMNLAFDVERGRTVGFGGWADPNSDETWELYTRGGVCGADAGTCPSGACENGVCCEVSCGECGRCDGPTRGVCTTVADGTPCSSGGTCTAGACSFPADSGAADGSGIVDGGGTPAADSSSDGASEPSGGKKGGCSVATGASQGASSGLGLGLGLAALGARRRRRRG